MRNFGDHLVLHDKPNCTKPVAFDLRLRYVWGQDRVVIVNPSSPRKVLYKVICQRKERCLILGWTRNRTNVTIVASVNTMAWYPYPTRDDLSYYMNEERDEADDVVKSKALLERPLLIFTKVFDEVLNVTFSPSQRKYTIVYGTHRTVAEIENFDRSTPQRRNNENYFLRIVEDTDAKVDPALLVSICISIDYIEWPYYLSSA